MSNCLSYTLHNDYTAGVYNAVYNDIYTLDVNRVVLCEYSKFRIESNS